jgi:cold shock CspA family protein
VLATSPATHLASLRPGFNATTELKPESQFIPAPHIVERYAQFYSRSSLPQSPDDFPKGIEYRKGWVKWYNPTSGFGFISYYDEATKAQVDIYFHASEFIQLDVTLGEAENLSSVIIDGNYIEKVPVEIDGNCKHTTPVPDLQPQTELRFIYGNHPKNGPHACRWFLVESLKVVEEVAQTFLENVQKVFASLPRYSLFIEERTDTDQSWDTLSGNHLSSELWYETNHFPYLCYQWHALQHRLNWRYQRLVVIVERVLPNGTIETDVACNFDELTNKQKELSI